MQSYRQRRKRIELVKIMTIITAILLAVVLLDMKIRPSVETMAAYQARLFAIRSINDAVGEELASKNITYDSLIKLSTTAGGTVTAIETDMLSLNRLKVGITDAVVHKLNGLEAANLKIPMGTLFGGQIFSGRGPSINFRILNAGYVQSDIMNQFDSAGINQTRHQIMLKITIHITALLPGYSANTEVTTNVTLAETIIVGVVPDAFTKVTGDEGSTISKLNDYRADKAAE